ncbi:MAG: tyrosine-type recombinase/integrase [Gammaproteobacteria bacterium]|nr:tyrosine-type recombinase/integrase [Gammaproteobacteria bacterium]
MTRPHAAGELVDHRGRKYLTAGERTRFLDAVRAHPKPTVQILARTLALTGCRVSDALGVRACDVDLEAAELWTATLKRRRSHWRAVPVRFHALEIVHRVRRAQASPRGRTRSLWPITRQTANR